MTFAEQGALQQRTGFFDQGAGYANWKGFDGPQGHYGPPQGGGYSVQQSYGPNNGAYGGQVVGDNEYVDRKGRVRRRKVRGGKFACCLGLCWCITWPCHGPCLGGL